MATLNHVLPGLLSLLALVAIPSTLLAHRLDEYLQATLADIEPDRIRLQVNLQPGVAVAERVLLHIDRDSDAAISAAEAGAYLGLLRQDLSLRIDGRAAPLHLIHSAFPAAAELRSGAGIIRVEFSTTFSALTVGAHRLDFSNRHLASDSVYLFNAVQPSSNAVRIDRQRRNRNQSTGEIEFTVQSR